MLAAVQDLYTWYLRTRSGSGRADSLIRGVACLLGNHLAAASQPLLLALLDEARAAGAPPSELDALAVRIATATAPDDTEAYTLFGELLALYLRERGA